MCGDKRRLAYLHRAERTGHFQTQRSVSRGRQLALRQERVLGGQKQMAEVLVRPSAGALDVLAEERAAGTELPRAVQLRAGHSHPETGTGILVIMYVGP